MMDRAAPVEEFPVFRQGFPVGSMLHCCLILPGADKTFPKAGHCITGLPGMIFFIIAVQVPISGNRKVERGRKTLHTP